MTYLHRRNNRRRRTRSSTLLQTTAATAGAGALLLAVQLVHVVCTTPRLPPPDESGYDFPEDGLRVGVGVGEDDDDAGSGSSASDSDGGGGAASHCAGESAADHAASTTMQTSNEFNLVLLGDSPVQGIGCPTHSSALGGRAAHAFSRALNRPVRYWSYGKSGLTAQGIKEEMVPRLQKVVDKGRRVDAIVMSCGVNNVLSGHSAGRFGIEVERLLDAIDSIVNESYANNSQEQKFRRPRILLVELLDFSHMPFLPWPLSSVLGWRSRCLQTKMEEIVERRRRFDPNANIVIARIPPVEDLLDGSRHDLLDHLDEEEVKELERDHFFAADGFHPADHGTVLLGNVIVNTYLDRT